MVPLSEHEQRLLDQIEQALYADDPKFASAVRSARSRSRTRRWVLLSASGVVIGLAVILIALLVKSTAATAVLGVIGFVLIVVSCAYAASSLRGRAVSSPESPTAGTRARRNSGVRSRMEDRLRRRFDEN